MRDIQKKQTTASDETQMLLKKQNVGAWLTQFLEKEVAESQAHLNDLVHSIERANAPA